MQSGKVVVQNQASFRFADDVFDISIRTDVLATYNVYVNFLKTEAFPEPTSNAVMRFSFLSTAVQTRVFKVFLQKYTIYPSPLHPFVLVLNFLLKP